MKKLILLFFCTAFILRIGHSQGTTSYGDGAGTLGTANSFFGRGAGSNQGPTQSSFNTAIGYSSMNDYGVGENNTAVGAHSLVYGGQGCTAIGFYALWSNSLHPWPPDATEEAYYNTAVGYRSMSQNGMGDYNTAVGAETLYWNEGQYNSAFGYHALHTNYLGQYNTASGGWSLYSNSSGDLNTANGYHSLYSNTTGYQNTAIGYKTLYSNIGGYRNTAIGTSALNNNISGNFNTAIGYYAAYGNNLGTHNTANGFRALDSNTTGSYNTAHGAFSLEILTAGNYNTALGYNAGPTTDFLNNTTAIGYLAIPTASNQVRLGNAAVTSIGGQVSWTAFSDGRFKKDIKEDVTGLDFIKQLRPVSYTVDQAGLNKFLHMSDSSLNSAESLSADRQTKTTPMRQSGFVAQEVEAIVKKTGYVFSGVDAPENENDPYGIRYADFVVPLVKAVQELSTLLEQERKTNEEQRTQIESLLGHDSERKIENSYAMLFQNNPNPFHAETEIKMTVPENVGLATVTIYNLEGKQLKNVQVQDRGDVTLRISANELSAGMYLYTLIVDGKVIDTKRMILTQ